MKHSDCRQLSGIQWRLAHDDQTATMSNECTGTQSATGNIRVPLHEQLAFYDSSVLLGHVFQWQTFQQHNIYRTSLCA